MLPTAKFRNIPDFSSGEILTPPRMTDMGRGINEALRILGNYYEEEQPLIRHSKIGLFRYNQAAPGNGKYWLREYLPTTGDVSPSVSLTSASFGNLNSMDVLGLNADEENGSGHDLGSGNFPQTFPAFKLQYNSTGILVVVFSAMQWENCPAAGAPPAAVGNNFLLMGA